MDRGIFFWFFRATCLSAIFWTITAKAVPGSQTPWSERDIEQFVVDHNQALMPYEDSGPEAFLASFKDYKLSVDDERFLRLTISRMPKLLPITMEGSEIVFRNNLEEIRMGLEDLERGQLRINGHLLKVVDYANLQSFIEKYSETSWGYCDYYGFFHLIIPEAFADATTPDAKTSTHISFWARLFGSPANQKQKIAAEGKNKGHGQSAPITYTDDQLQNWNQTMGYDKENHRYPADEALLFDILHANSVKCFLNQEGVLDKSGKRCPEEVQYDGKKYKLQLGYKPEGMGINFCYRYASIALSGAKWTEKYLPDALNKELKLPESVSCAAFSASMKLTDPLFGFVKCDKITSIDKAPIGSILVYKAWGLPGDARYNPYGHIEVRTPRGYVSDHFASFEDRKLSMHFWNDKLMGVYVKKGKSCS